MMRMIALLTLILMANQVEAKCKSMTLNGEITVGTSGQKFYDIQSDVEQKLTEGLGKNPKACKDGILYLFIMHTSAALGITESSDDEAKLDIMSFLDQIAPRGDKPGVTYLHSLEGPDDSPSHLKSVILNQSLTVPVTQGKLDLGQWQKVYLMEFRDAAKSRLIKFKYKAD